MRWQPSTVELVKWGKQCVWGIRHAHIEALEMKSEKPAGELRMRLRSRVLPGMSRPWIPSLALPGRDNKAGQNLRELNLQNIYLSLKVQNSLGFV